MPEGQTDQQPEVDEKGVPWSNRVKELERKLTDREREFQELQTWKQNYEAEQVRETQTQPDPKEKLMQFVGNPDGYIESLVEAREKKRMDENYKSELTRVRPWLATQKEYKQEDDVRLLEIEREYALSHPSPLQRVSKAYDILQKEKALARFNSTDDDKKREEQIRNNAPEGTGKATSKDRPITRNDLLRKLADAEAKGDLDASIKLISALEDVR